MQLPQNRIVFALVVLGLTVFNPLHLPWSLPWLTDLFSGTGFGNFLAEREGTIIVLGTVYFTATMIPVYYWIWRRTSQRRGQDRAPVRVSAAVPGSPTAPATTQTADSDDDDEYRGPGGGKRPPRPSRSRRRRARPRR